jgi:hypothetical protein
MSKWEQYCERAPHDWELARWIRYQPDAGIGLPCGFNGLVAIDVDNEKAYAAVREVFGGIHPPTKIGRKGATAFFNAKGAKIQSRKFCEKRDPVTRKWPALVEILSTGNQTVIPDTMHPDTGKPYRWVHANLLEVRHPKDLPVITHRHIDDLKASLAQFMEPVRAIAARVTERKASLSDLERRRYEGFAHKALEAEAARIASQPKPGRNRELFRAVCNLGKFAANGILPSKLISDRLLEACDRNRLKDDNGMRDVMKTIQAGFNYARNDPLPQLQERPA